MMMLPILSILVGLMSNQAPALAQTNVQIERHAVPTEAIIAVKTTTQVKSLTEVNGVLAQSLKKMGSVKLVQVILSMNHDNGGFLTLVKVESKNQNTIQSLLNKENLPSQVEWVSPNYSYEGPARDVVNLESILTLDPQLSSQYHHPVMKNAEAWRINSGRAEIVVAVTDDGVDTTHEDLRNNIWVNSDEIPNNGIDDDHNGYIDDVNGWDFANDNNDPNPNGSGNEHGTHVAGIVAASLDNGVGVSGTAPGVKVMPLQFYGGANSWTSDLIARTYAYAADNGAKIITTSYAIDQFATDRVYEAGLDYAYQRGVMHFNSAGNNNQDNPQRTKFEQLLLVCSTVADQISNDVRSDFSNYGTGVDVCAPGGGGREGILSTLPSNDYGRLSGTSMASPNAAAVAALVWSAHPEWTRDQVAEQILGTTDNIDRLNTRYVGKLGAGRLNSLNALTATPAAPKLASAITVRQGSIEIKLSGIFDAASVSRANAWELREAGADQAFGTSDDVLVPMSLLKPYKIGSNFFYFRTGTLTPGKYQVKGFSSVLRSPQGIPLDGDGNNLVGGDYVSEFRL